MALKCVNFQGRMAKYYFVSLPIAYKHEIQINVFETVITNDFFLLNTNHICAGKQYEVWFDF